MFEHESSLMRYRWDKQEMRNYGEPVHEDNDILGVFSPHEYTHFTPGWGAVLLGTYIGAFGVLCAVVSLTYPDRVSLRREQITYERWLTSSSLR